MGTGLCADEVKPPYQRLTSGPAALISDSHARALAGSAQIREAVARLHAVRERSAAVREYVLARSTGVCEGCGTPAPFVTAQGAPYLEPHHTRRLSDGGPDHPAW